MDRLDHDIVQDLLPLYHDGVCSEKSRAAVEEHLKACETCRAALAAMDAPLPEAEKAAAGDDAAAVQKISSEWKRSKRRAHIIGVIAAVVVCAAVAVGIWALTTWTCIPWTARTIRWMSTAWRAEALGSTGTSGRAERPGIP